MKTALCLIAVVALLNRVTTGLVVSHGGGPRGVTSASRHDTPRTRLYAAATKKSKKKSKDDEVETFRKADFVSSVAEKTGLTKVDSESALNAVLETITEQVSSGKRINLVGFGTFKLSRRSARKGRNPQTGEELDIAASNSPSFTASKTFKEKCN